MCFYTQQTKEAVAVENRFNAKIINKTLFQTKNIINAFSFPKTPIITNDEKNLIQHFQWGLIPFWAKNDSIKKYTLNAKIETLHKKPSFRNAVNNRCLIIANGFYEWQWLDVKGKKKQRYLITLTDDELFAFAGIWSKWIDNETGEIVNSYSMITTEANKLMSKIHNTKKRMPVILSKDNENDWLMGNTIDDFKKVKVDLKAIEF